MAATRWYPLLRRTAKIAALLGVPVFFLAGMLPVVASAGTPLP